MKNNLDTLIGYENKIVDLSRRNRLLNYPKNGKIINFDLNLQQFITHFGTLDELSIEFLHRSILNEEESKEADSKENDAYIPPTTPQGEKLIDLLSALRLDTKRKFEEHGLHTLFLAIGHVRWKEPGVGSRKSGNIVEGYDFNAPLLLVPLNIEEKKNPKKTVVATNLETCDITVNTVLNLLLGKEFSARSLTFNSTDKASDSNTEHDWLKIYQDLCNEAEAIFSELKLEFEITHEIQIKQYSFLGQQIYEDLHCHEEAIIKHEFINALSSHAQLRQANLDINSDNPDILLTAADDFNIMDADRSQLEVVQKAINGNHLNIQGPPGTGKSQTIVNLISNFLAREKTVLLVCEKQVALEVVLERLKQTNLDRLCLPLFHFNADKKTFAKSLIEDREKIIRSSSQAPNEMTLNTPLAKRSKRIAQLRNYADALGKVVSPLNKSVFWVHGELAKQHSAVQDKAIPWKGSDPLKISNADYDKVMHLLNGLSEVFNIGCDEKLSHWKTIQKWHNSPDFVIKVNDALEQLKNLLLRITNLDCTFVAFNSLAPIKELAELQELVKTIQPLDKQYVIDVDLKSLNKELSEILSHIDQYNKLNNSFSNSYAIPFNWKQLNGSLSDSKIQETTRISQIKSAAIDASIIKAHLDTINRVHEEINTSIPIQLDELLLYKNLLQIDPTIKNLKNWTLANSLRSIAEQLKELLKLYNRVSKAQGMCDKWNLVLTEIDTAEAIPLCNRFENTYGPILRYFYPQYRKDCTTLTNWCDADIKPRKFSHYVEIAKCIKDNFKFSEMFKKAFDNFKQEHLAPTVTLEPSQISAMLNDVKNILDWLEIGGKAKLPDSLVQLIENSEDYQSINAFIQATDEIHAMVESSWNIFQLNTKKKLSIKDLICLYPVLQQSIEQALTLHEAVRAVHNQTSYDCTLKELKSNALEIDKLADQLEHIKHIEALFGDREILTQMISNPNLLKSLQTNLSNLDNLVKAGLNAPCTMTVKQAVTYIGELQRVFPIIQEWLKDYEAIIQELNYLFGAEACLAHLEKLSFSAYIKTVDTMLSDQAGLEKWMQYRRYTHQLTDAGHAWFLKATQDKAIANPTSLFAQALWSRWLEAYYAQQPALQNFSLKEHEHIIKEFQDLEEKTLSANATRIFEIYAPKFRIYKKLATDEDKKLVHQSELKMRHKPIRKLVKEIGKQLLHYKPCWMMSPLTLSSYIPYGALDFDVVIFDEASQMRVEHALGAIARAKQVLIFGDENQLPPTSFFEVSSDGEPEDDDMVEDYESILHATKEILPGAHCLLSHHYRSKYEELIAFSNHYVYQDQLVTFPNPKRTHSAVQFEYVKEGVFDGGSAGGRCNYLEAQRVVALCLQHAAESAGKSLGVIAFSKSQEVCIRQSLQSHLKRNPQFQAFLDETSDAHASFFIKNLESVQGDERDVIILSVGYGRDKRTGEVYNRFGPLNTQHGYRRLNVAVTRAKEKIICVSSMKATDIRNAEKSRGAFLLQKYLEYAERGVESLDASLLAQNQNGIMADSPFEEEVERALQARGYKVHRQVGASGFKIDLAILDPKNDQQYVLGIECDGSAYHSSYSARMNDRIRQDILEHLGWKIYRVWSQHWISHKEEILDNVSRMIADE